MCRMIGVISTRPISAFKYLVEDECSLIVQARKGKQSDGWGIGYYRNGLPSIFKSPHPAYHEEKLFREISRNVVSNIIIAHVRKASNPRKLPRHMLIGIENSQPFYFRNYLFVHNGTIFIPDEVMKILGEYKSLIKGVNDSEVYFAYLIKKWKEKGNPLEALRSIEKELWEILRRSRRDLKMPYNSLNAMFSDGNKFYAVTLYLRDKEPKSICYKDSEYFRMAYCYEGDKLIVASERTNNSENWKLMSNREVLEAEFDGDEIRYKIVKL